MDLSRRVMRFALSSKEVIVGKSAVAFIRATMVHLSLRTRMDGSDSTFKKILVVRTIFDRTANRHRWAGREY